MSEPDVVGQIVPDTKDWTWVPHRPRPECGLAVGTTAVTEVPDVLRDDAARWSAVLARPDVEDGGPNGRPSGRHAAAVVHIFLPQPCARWGHCEGPHVDEAVT